LHIAIALLAPIATLGDEAPRPYWGTTLGPFIPTAVKMIEEEVWMEVGPHRIDVRAEFIYFNPGATESIQVGFPDVVMAYNNEERTLISSSPGKFFGEPTLKDIRIRFDNEPVAYSFASTPRGYYRGWLLFDAVFPRGETMTSTVEYWVEPTLAYRRGVLGDQQFTYVLKTGKDWAGPIGKATLHMKLDPAIEPSQVLSISPGGYQTDSNEYHWTLTDFEPNRNIRIEYQAYTAKERIRQRQAQFLNAKGDMSIPQVCYRLSEQELGWLLTDLYVCGTKTNDYHTALMACDWALSIEKKKGDLPNSLINERDSGGKPNKNWGGDDVPWEMARAVALLRLGRQEEASDYFAQTTLPVMEAYLLDQAKDDDRYRGKKSWLYRTYLAPDIKFQDLPEGVQFPDPRCLLSEYNFLKELLSS
jgi:hypothetical protein